MIFFLKILNFGFLRMKFDNYDSYKLIVFLYEI